MEKVWLLFHDVESAMRLHRILRADGMKISIAPTPREASKCCGVCILLDEPEDAEKAVRLAADANISLRGIHRMNTDFNPGRDKYC